MPGTLRAKTLVGWMATWIDGEYQLVPSRGEYRLTAEELRTQHIFQGTKMYTVEKFHYVTKGKSLLHVSLTQ